MNRIIDSKNAPTAIGPYSQAIGLGNLLFVSGQLPIEPTSGLIVATTMTEQAEQVCKNVGAILEEAGISFGDVVKTTCFLSEMDGFNAFNECYAQYFTGKPARSCVEVKSLPKGALCEIEVIAKKNTLQ